MTYEETLERTQRELEHTKDVKRGCIRLRSGEVVVNQYEEIVQHLQNCIEAIEKQIPKKFKQKEPISVKAFDGVDKILIMHTLPCPCCGKWIVVNKSNRYRYCERCGQALDWSD